MTTGKAEKENEKLEAVRLSQTKFFFVVIVAGYLGMWLIPLFNDYSKEEEAYLVRHAWENTRDISSVKWHVVPFLVVTLYFIFQHVEREQYGKLFAALAFFLMDWFNEVYNSYFYNATGYSPLWTCHRKESSFMVMIGWNIEIIFNFAMCGLLSTMLLHRDKNKMYFGFLNNRHFWAFFCATLSLIVEIGLNEADLLIWNYWWWSTRCPWLIFINGYLVFYELAYFVYDSPRSRQIKIVVGMFIFNAFFTTIGWYIGWV